MSHKKLRPFIVKVSVLGYFPLLSFDLQIISMLFNSVNALTILILISLLFDLKHILRYVKYS